MSAAEPIPEGEDAEARLVRRAAEALLLVTEDPLPAELMAQLLEVPVARVAALCAELAAEYDATDRGFQLVQVAGGWRYQTHPDLAPYGVASGEALVSLGIARDVAPRLVYGENIGQAYALVASGNADLGFVARSQVLQRQDAREAGWAVPASHHAPIRQELVLLSRAAGNAGARAFVTWLASDAARATIRAAGYEVD